MIERNGDALQVKGAMLNSTATALLEAGRGLLRAAAGEGALRVDLSAVEESDASALGVLFAWMRTAREIGLELRVAHVPASMVSQAKLYGVYDTLPLA